MPFHFKAFVNRTTVDLDGNSPPLTEKFRLPELSTLRCVSTTGPNANGAFLEDTEVQWTAITNPMGGQRFAAQIDPKGPWSHLSMITPFGNIGFRTGLQQFQDSDEQFNIIGYRMTLPLSELQQIADLPSGAAQEDLPRFVRSISYDYRFGGAPDLEVQVDMQVNLRPRGRIRAGVKFTMAIKPQDLRPGSSKLVQVEVTAFKLTRFLPRLLSFISAGQIRKALRRKLQSELDDVINTEIMARATEHDPRPPEQIPLSLFGVSCDGLALRVLLTSISRGADTTAIPRP